MPACWSSGAEGRKNTATPRCEALLAGILGLTLLDSLNPATLVAITLILVGDPPRPVLSALAFVAGAVGAVLALGAVVFVSARAAAEVLTDGLVRVRRAAFGAAAAGLLVAAVRRLRPRPRRSVRLPGWFSPITALPLGVVMTAADLPDAFPYFIAIERLLAAGLAPATVVLAGYAVLYCLPCLVLLTAGRLLHGRIRPLLQRLVDRLTTGTAACSIPAAAVLALLAAGLAGVALTA